MPTWAYVLVALTGGLMCLALWRRYSVPHHALTRQAAWLLALALLAFSSTGLRGVRYGTQALAPVLEGSDVRITGVVANLPQRNEAGLRFSLAVESASRDGVEVPVPPRIDVGWYGSAAAVGIESTGPQRCPAMSVPASAGA